MQNSDEKNAIQKDEGGDKQIEMTDQKNFNSAKKLMDDDSPSKKKEGDGSMRKSGKVSANIEGPKNYPLSYAYGAVSAFALGWSLYFSADLGTRHDGFVGPASFWPGCILTWFCFHMKDWIMHKLGKVPDQHPGEKWFSSKRSMYYELFFVDEEEEA